MNLIYKHTSKINGKAYVGKTSISMEKRFSQHIKSADRNKGKKSTHFENAILKYGIEDFSSEILEDKLSGDEANVREKYWIEYYDTFNNGYNQTKGGEGASGYKQTSEHKEKIRQKNLGLKRTEEQIRNISEAHKGQNAWNKGQTLIPLSEEHKKKISKAKKGIKQNLIKCPYCDKEGGKPIMKRWHFEKCKYK